MKTRISMNRTVRCLIPGFALLASILSAAAGHAAPLPSDSKIIFLHHSTGQVIWEGGVPEWFEKYNAEHGTKYDITERAFPSGDPYPWENYPYDYWNIWVKHAGNSPWKTEPTLEILTRQYKLIVWKHCFPVSGIEPDTGKPDIASNVKSLENYKVQYAALKTKMRSFSSTRFLVWTGAALLKSDTDAGQADRAKSFFAWVKNTWDEKGDNIFVWDFQSLETDGGLYLKDEHAAGSGDSHPGADFAREVAPYLCRRIVDVIAGKGDTASITGK